MVPNATIEYVAGVSHVPQIESPAWYREHLSAFVESVVGRAAA